MFKILRSTRGEVNILLISTLLLGLSTLIFGILAIYAYTNNQQTQKATDVLKAASYKQGQAAQRDADNKEYATANALPYRQYKAPDLYGNFVISFPKNWNAYVIEDQTALTQVNLLLHPVAVKLDRSIRTNLYAFRALLINQKQSTLYDTYYKNAVKAGRLTEKSVTVSGIGATWLDGKFDAEHNGIIVLVPVRDKTLEFITDSHDFVDEFNQILKQSTIVR